MKRDVIYIMDFGGSQAYYTARRLRGEQFYCEVVPQDTDPSQLISNSPKGIVLVGSGSDALNAGILPFDPAVFGVPVLALGGAARMLAETIHAEHLGIQLENSKEFLRFQPCDLFADLSENDRVFERVDGYALPEGYEVIASTPAGLMPGFACLEKKIYALQFYVESNDPEGLKILENFAGDICQSARNWNVDNYATELIDMTTEQIGNGRVLAPISGGLNSAVTAALLHRAAGNRVDCLFIDTGLLRKGDAAMIHRTFCDLMGLNLIEVEAHDRFMRALAGVTDANEKRRILADEFSAIFAEQYIKAGNVECMADGTIYPDILKKRAHMNTRMIEGCRKVAPLKMLFKEEVRALGRFLGVPDELINRPSFASPGLAVRCMGEVTPERLAMLREADSIFRQEIDKSGLSRKIAQYFAILTNLKTPGAAGEGYVCVLRALSASNAGSAHACRLPYDVTDSVVERITSEVPGINHVVYDITGRPTAAVEWE